MNGSAKAIVCVGPVSPKEPVDTTKITILPELGFELWSANLIAQLDVAIDEHMKQVEAFREIEEGLAMDAEDAETVRWWSMRMRRLISWSSKNSCKRHMLNVCDMRLLQ